MKWWMHWLPQLAMSRMPGGDVLHRWMQDRLGEHRRLESSTRFENAEWFLQQALQQIGGAEDPLVVEIGTGWIPAVPLTMLVAGLRVQTYDIARHVDELLFERTRDVLQTRTDRIATVAGIAVDAVQRRLDAIHGTSNFAVAAEVLGGQYKAPADTADLPMNDATVDVVFSNLVLQCIPREALPPVLEETFRILKPGGHAIHRIYMGDEYAGRDPNRDRLHYLVYDDRTWRRWFCHRLKHLNRLRASQFLTMLTDLGFEIVHAERSVDEVSIQHLKRTGVDAEFQDLEWDDIATTSLEVTLRKPTAIDADATVPCESEPSTAVSS